MSADVKWKADMIQYIYYADTHTYTWFLVNQPIIHIWLVSKL